MKSKFFILSFLIALLFGVGATAEAQVESEASANTSVSTSGSIFEDFSVAGRARLLVGNSSNVGLLSEETEAGFFKIAPELSIDWEPSDSLILTLAGEAGLKRYGDDVAKALGNETFYEARLELLYFLSDAWEAGGSLSYYGIENSVPSISDSGVSTAVLQKYSEPSARIYLAWFGETLSIEGAGFVKSRSYVGTFTDQQGNVYKNDFTEYRGEGNLGYRLGEDTKAKLQVKVGRELYVEKMAAFSEGLEPFPNQPHPELRVFYHEYALGLDSLLGSVATKSKVATRFNVDEIFGAESHTKYSLQQRLQIPLLSGLTFSPEASVALKDYEFYRSNPTTSASTKPTRRDIEFRAASDLAYKFSDLISFTAHYEFNRLVSNYATLTYSEHQLESGVSVSF